MGGTQSEQPPLIGTPKPVTSTQCAPPTNDGPDDWHALHRVDDALQRALRTGQGSPASGAKALKVQPWGGYSPNTQTLHVHTLY